MVDVLLPQQLDDPLRGPRQFFVDVNIGIVSSNFFISDVNIASGQPKNFPHTQ